MEFIYTGDNTNLTSGKVYKAKYQNFARLGAYGAHGKVTTHEMLVVLDDFNTPIIVNEYFIEKSKYRDMRIDKILKI